MSYGRKFQPDCADLDGCIDAKIKCDGCPTKVESAWFTLSELAAERAKWKEEGRREALDEAHPFLERVEWVEDSETGVYSCPFCGAGKINKKHFSRCPFAKLLGRDTADTLDIDLGYF